MCHCLWLCIESYHILQTHCLKAAALLSGNRGLGWGEDWFLLRVQHGSPAATRPSSTSIILSFLPKCQDTFWVGFEWDTVIKPLMLIEII